MMEKPTIKNEISDLLGRSFDNKVCLMPHQVIDMQAENVLDGTIHPDTGNQFMFNLKTNLTSWSDTVSYNNSIGLVYFNSVCFRGF